MAVDLATLAIELNTTGLEQGVKRAQSALQSLESRFDQTVNKAQKVAQTINTAFSGVNVTRATQAFSQAQTGADKYATTLLNTANAQRKASDEAIKHAQALARLQRAQGDTVGAIKSLQGALSAHNGSLRQTLAAQTQLAQLQSSQSFSRYAGTVREAGESIQAAGAALTGLSAALIGVGAASVRSAFDIDRNVNVLKAFLGGVDAAEARLKQLIALSQQTPGLTAGLATTIDAQLRVAGATQRAIDRVLPAIGRLNAVSRLQDPQRFVQNLVQLVTQNFERIDLKELVGQSPLAGELIKEVFNVNSPINAEAIRASAKRLGITTVDAFFEAIGRAAEQNQKLGAITESLETKFAKLADRVSIALRPLGVAILDAAGPIVEKAVKVLEKLSAAFIALPRSVQQAIIIFGALAAALGPAVLALGAFIQTAGAIGNLVTVFGALGGTTGGIAGLSAAIGAIAPILGAVALAVGALATAWATNFGDIRGVTSEAVGFIRSGFGEITEFFRSLGPELQKLRSVLEAANSYFQAWSENTKIALRGAFEILQPIVKGVFQIIGSDLRVVLKLLQGDLLGAFVELGNGVKKALTAIENAFNASLDTMLKAGKRFFDILADNSSVVRAGRVLAESFARSFINTLKSFAPNVGSTVESFLRGVRDTARARTPALPAAPQLTAPGLPANINQLLYGPTGAPPPTPTNTGGALSRTMMAEARAIRDANEQLAKASADAQFDIQGKLIKNILELDKDAYDKRLISAEDYYDRVARREIELQEIARRRIQAEIDASTARQRGAKAGSPEALREQAQQIELQKQLRIIELERPNILRKINDELEKAIRLERERGNALIAASVQADIDRQRRLNEEIEAKRQLERNRPDFELRQQELRLEGQARQGLITERELTDALILTRRQYRAELIAAAEARKLEVLSSDDPRRFDTAARIDEEIESLRNLGAELTRAESLRRRFAEQATINYGQLNEGVEDLLASQKGLTEIFQDFRRNQVSDVFGLIEKGVDKLTQRLGILGDAVGQLLKDLLKLAATEIFKKLFGISGGGVGFGGATAGGGGGAVGGLFSRIFGGGGGGNFTTGGFAGGNPAAQILGGGGGLNFGGLLGRIPGLGRLFGGGGAAGVRDPGLLLGGDTGAGGGFGAISASGGIGAGFAAGGLLAGGGILGSLLGGQSSVGRLAGGVGGTLLSGFLGASLSSGIAGALPAFFTNPITAIIGGALIGVGLLSRLFANRDLKDYRKHIRNEYAVDVKAQRTLEQIREIGKQAFGADYKGKRIETVRLPQSRELISEYAQRTGQKGNSKLFSASDLQDPFNESNRFVVRRALGGFLRAYQPAIVGDGGRPEVVVPTANSFVFPSIRDFEQAGSRQAPLAPQSQGWDAEQRAHGRLLLDGISALIDVLANLRGIPGDHVIVNALKNNPEIATDAVAASFRRRSGASNEVRNLVYQR